MPVKLSFETVKEYFEQRGLRLLEEFYINSETPMRYLCACGNESYMSYKNAKKGRNCKECGRVKLSKVKRIYEHPYIRRYFEDHGCTLITDSYDGDPHKKMDYICICSSISKISWSNFKRGARCKNCRTVKVADVRRKYTMDEIRALFKIKGKVLLEEGEFVNSRIPLNYVCKCGRHSKINLNNFFKDKDCSYCRNIKISEKAKDPNISDDERQIKRQYPEYKQWRFNVYERDSYTCQCCFSKGARLNAHHIMNYSENRELRTSVSNGITLCLNCHKNFHLIYGKSNNNAIQLAEFLNTLK